MQREFRRLAMLAVWHTKTNALHGLVQGSLKVAVQEASLAAWSMAEKVVKVGVVKVGVVKVVKALALPLECRPMGFGTGVGHCSECQECRAASSSHTPSFSCNTS